MPNPPPSPIPHPRNLSEVTQPDIPRQRQLYNRNMFQGRLITHNNMIPNVQNIITFGERYRPSDYMAAVD